MKLGIAVVIGALLSGCASLAPRHVHEVEMPTATSCFEYAGWYCSHHPLTYETVMNLVCVDSNCNLKVDWVKTGAKFLWMELPETASEQQAWGYVHVHDKTDNKQQDHDNE